MHRWWIESGGWDNREMDIVAVVISECIPHWAGHLATGMMCAHIKPVVPTLVYFLDWRPLPIPSEHVSLCNDGISSLLKRIDTHVHPHTHPYLHHGDSCDVSLVHKDRVDTDHVRQSMDHHYSVVTAGNHLVTMAMENADRSGVGGDCESENAIVTNQIQRTIHVTRDNTTRANTARHDILHEIFYLTPRVQKARVSHCTVCSHNQCRYWSTKYSCIIMFSITLCDVPITTVVQTSARWPLYFVNSFCTVGYPLYLFYVHLHTWREAGSFHALWSGGWAQVHALLVLSSWHID